MKRLDAFLNSKKDYPILTGISAGLFPILFYYSRNYTISNSWGHVGYFSIFFLILPIVACVAWQWIAAIKPLRKYRTYLLALVNLSVFLITLKLCVYGGVQVGWSLLLVAVSALIASFGYRHLKKLIVFQLLLAVTGVFSLVPTIIRQVNYSSDWMKQPDHIEQTVFKQRPGVYVLQPDGYTNDTELAKDHYGFDNSDFSAFLDQNGFRQYPGFRSNYVHTLVSNSATFMMKHHYCNNGWSFGEAIDARSVIVSSNTVLDVFKKNGYKTYLITERPYLLQSRPEMGYEEHNISYDDIAFVSTGMREEFDALGSLREYVAEAEERPKFFFVQLFKPGHVSSRKGTSQGVDGERRAWLDRLVEANQMLRDAIETILEYDSEALIIVMADHGGYVGLDYGMRRNSLIRDRDLVHSLFSSHLSIRWPNGEAPEYESELKSAVNVFRVLFAYLSGDVSLMDNLQENGSYVNVMKGAPKGVYRYLDDEGNLSIERIGLGYD